MDNINQEGIKVEGLSDDALDEQLRENFGVVDEDKKVEETTPEPSTENKPNEDTPPSSQGEEDKGDEKKKESKPESKNIEDEEEKKVPFHKHPRFQKLVKDKKEAEGKNKEYEERLQRLENPPEEEKLSPIPGWFAGDENEWQVFCQEQQTRDEKVKNNTINEINLAQQEKEEKLSKLDNWVNEEIDKLEDDPDIEKFNRNELMKTVLENRPTDEDGNLDFRRGYNLMVQLKGKEVKVNDKKKEKIDEKKKIISTDTDTGSDGDDNENRVVTADDIRHKSFGQLAT